MRLLLGILILTCLIATAEEEPHFPPPGRLNTSDLTGFEDLPANRRRLITASLDLQTEYPLDRYIYGSADPENGGFDCSGAMFYLLRQQGLKPPRSSDRQFRWLEKGGQITFIPEEVDSLNHPVFDALRPGDLLFWSGTYEPEMKRVNKVTHVQMYLGIEKASGQRVMVGATSGRTYNGTQRTGYGVYDLRFPRKSSSSKLVGFGPPPGLTEPATED